MDAPELDQETRDQIDAAEDLAGNYDDDDRDDIKTDVINAFYRGVAWQKAREAQRRERLRQEAQPLLNDLHQMRAQIKVEKNNLVLCGISALILVAETLLRWFTEEPKQ